MGYNSEDEEDKDLAYARKYRTNTLNGYVGNTDLKESVIRYLVDKRPQSVLLSGNSGCGKTTMARLIGKEYCCENRDPVKGACNECPSCLAFNEYIKFGTEDYLNDIYEIDSSQNGSKKDVDAMLDSMEYPAMSGDWKIYIMDEAHLLSEGAMGRLLKSLEEPPEGVLIILCTTDPDKLLDTVKNRCQLKLQVSKPNTMEIMDLLQKVCLNEDKNYDLAGLRMLVARSDNVVRDALNNVERVLATRGDATADSVSAEFKEVSDKLVYAFYDAYYSDDYVSYIDIMYQIRMKYDFNQFITMLTLFTTRGIYIINSVEVEGLSQEELQSYLKLFKRFTPRELSYILSSLKRMNTGDVEANLMSFIYCKNDPEVSTSIEPTVNPESITVDDEHLLRNSNLERLESAKLVKGTKSLGSQLEEVGLDSMKDFFTLEKVEGTLS